MAETNGNGTARWQLWVSVAGTAVMLMGSLLVLTWRVNSAYEGVNALTSRVANIENIARTNRTDVQILDAQQREIETQISATDALRSVNEHHRDQVDALLWQKAYGAQLPIDGAPYPTVANRQPKIDAEAR